jgi:hypothetical protein
MKVLIFGGGISGLTVAHELLEKGFDVTLIEKDNLLGGMAKSRRENGVPSEHSWRGFAPFYKNTSELMKRITFNDETVYNNLSPPVNFYLLKDEESAFKPKLTLSDKIVSFYYGLKYLISNKRRDGYYKTELVPLLKNKLSEDGYDFLVEFMAGPGYGMEKRDVSYGHFFRLPTLALMNKNKYNHIHNDKHGHYNHTDNLWHVTTKPTHEAWIDPWKEYLISKGLKIHLNTELIRFNINDNEISSCIVSDGVSEFELKADEYVLCLNPFDAEKVFERSNTTKLHKQHVLLNEKTNSNQISFRIGFGKKLNFPKENLAFVMTDSEFNITWYPQETHWDEDVQLDNNGEIKSLWSGTILASYSISKLYNKKAIELSKDELMTDIIHQLLRSKSLQKLIHDNNKFYLTKDDIIYTEIWYEWSYDGNELKQKSKKWVNNISNEKFRPDQKPLIYSNLYLGGAHTKTSINIWSMEGAVESGKKISNIISKKYNKGEVYLFTHTDPWFLKLFKTIDDILYTLKLPNIVDIWLILVIVVTITLVYKLVN